MMLMMLGKCACAGICLCGAVAVAFSCMCYPQIDSVKTI